MKSILIKTLAFNCFFWLLTAEVKAQNWGFEAPASTPPLNWVAVTGTWRTVTDTVRTGNQAMAISAPATTGTTAGSGPGGQLVNSAGGTFLITILWAKSNTIDNGRVNIGFRRNTTNTLNPSATTSGQPANMDTNWTRIVSISNGPVVAGPAGPAIRAFRTLANPANTAIYIDDMIIYENATGVADTTRPEPATNAFFGASNNVLNWVNGIDNHADATGRAGMVIIRTTSPVTSLPALNDQAMYATTQGEAGVSTFTAVGATWTVVANLTDTTLTTFTDATAQPGTNYTYVIFMRDRAYNYSPGIAFITPCTGQPTVGTAAGSQTNVCAGDSIDLSLSISAASGIVYTWQSAALGSSNFSNILQGDLTNIRVRVNQSSQYRCIATCPVSNLSDTSNTISVNATPMVVVGPITQTNAGAEYTFRVNNAANYTSLTWDFDDGSTDTGRVVVHTFQTNRLYVVRVRGINSCFEDSSAVAVNVSTVSIRELDFSTRVNVYPNPASEVLYINSEVPVNEVRLINALGAQVYQQQLSEEQAMSINLQGYAAGTYWIQLKNRNGETARKMIQIQR